MAILMDCFGITETGKQRETNQDQFLIGDLRKSLEVFQTSLNVDNHTQLFGGSQGKLLLVADGMGGHQSGERASSLAVDTFAVYALNSLNWFYRLKEDNDEDFVEELIDALEKCQNAVLAEGASFPERRGMGTTLTMAYIIWPRAYIVHAGDSRCYLFRSGKLRQITKDHTVAQQFVDQGALQPQQAEDSKWSHMVWNVLGGRDDELKPEVHKFQLAAGDTLMLCTDGLTRHVGDQQIADLQSRDLSAMDICLRLVDAANAAGGSDNITVVVVQFEEPNESTECSARQTIDQPATSENDDDTDTQVVDIALTNHTAVKNLVALNPDRYKDDKDEIGNKYSASPTQIQC